MRVGAPLDGNLGPGNSTEHQRTHTNQGYGVILCFTRFCAPGSEQQGKQQGGRVVFPKGINFPTSKDLSATGKSLRRAGWRVLMLMKCLATRTAVSPLFRQPAGIARERERERCDGGRRANGCEGKGLM